MHRLQVFIQNDTELAIWIAIGVAAALTIAALIYSLEFRRYFLISLVITAILVWAALRYLPIFQPDPAPPVVPARQV